jgi:hypothetical protein
MNPAREVKTERFSRTEGKLFYAEPDPLFIPSLNMGLSVLHNAVVAWNMVHIEPVVEQLRAEGQRCDGLLKSKG